MPALGPPSAIGLMPLMRYRDVGVAVGWLRAAFGFEEHFSAKAPDGAIFYSELRLGNSMIMLGSVGEPSLDALMRQPDDTSSAQTQSCYVVVEDTDAHYARALAAGAEIVLDLKSDDLGGRGYSCRDLEGHIWNFGTYNPWKAQSASQPNRPAATGTPRLLQAAMVATLVGSIVTGWWIYGDVRNAVASFSVSELRDRLLGDHARRDAGALSTGTISSSAAQDAQAARQEAARANAETTRSRAAMAALKDELDRERTAKNAALGAASEARTDAARAKADLAAEKTKSDTQRPPRAGTDAGPSDASKPDVQKVQASTVALREELARERSAKEAALASSHEAQGARNAERAARERADAAVKAAQEELTRERAAKEEAMQQSAAAVQERLSALQTERDALKREVETLRERAKTDNAEASRTQRRRKATSAAVARRQTKTPKPEPVWPYSSW